MLLVFLSFLLKIVETLLVGFNEMLATAFARLAFVDLQALVSKPFDAGATL